MSFFRLDDEAHTGAAHARAKAMSVTAGHQAGGSGPALSFGQDKPAGRRAPTRPQSGSRNAAQADEASFTSF